MDRAYPVSNNYEITPLAERVLLAVILLAGALLRLWSPFEIPFTHDELSALYRAEFDSFGAMIEHGVMIDGHPAGVQVFLFYWTKLFGIGELTVKLPFIIFGIACIPLTYMIARKWFSGTAALLSAAFIATLQFPVMYSAVARPYASGLFFCLLLVLCWTYYLFGARAKLRWLIGFAFAAVACAYNHYFSLLFAAMVGLTGLFFLNKSNRLPYLGAGVTVLVLYLPHLGIFRHQLGMKGLTWLGKPGNDLFIQLLEYCFHHSLSVYMLVGTLFVIGLLGYKWSSRFYAYKFHIISLLWFVIPFLVGFIYSITVQPVIQYSTQLFSFPFLLFFLFGFADRFPKVMQIVLVSWVLILNTTTLVSSRKHYEVFYHKQPFKQFAELSRQWATELGAGSTLTIFNENPHHINYYYKKAGLQPNYLSIHGKEMLPNQFGELIRKGYNDYLIVGNIPMRYLKIVREVYPYMVRKDFGFTYELYCFARKAKKELIDVKTAHTFPVQPQEEGWEFNNAYLHLDTLDGNMYYTMDSIMEWGPVFTASLADLCDNRYDFIDISVKLKGIEPNSNASLIVELHQGGETIMWKKSPAKDYLLAANGMWQGVYAAIRPVDFVSSPKEMQDTQLKAYVWNKKNNGIAVQDFKVEVRRGNPMIYGLFDSMQ